MRIVWSALFLSQLLFVYVLQQTPEMKGLGGGPLTLFVEDGTMTPIYMVALLVFAASILVPKVVFATQVKKAMPNPFFLPFVLRMALNESLALMGFVVAMQSQMLSTALPFMGVALLRHLAMFPSSSKVDAWAQSKSF